MFSSEFCEISKILADLVTFTEETLNGKLDFLCSMNFLDYPHYSIQKQHLWASFKASKNRLRKLHEAIWLTVINEIFAFPSYLHVFFKINYLHKLFLGYPNFLVQKWQLA